MKGMTIRKRLIIGFTFILVVMEFIAYSAITTIMRVESGEYSQTYLSGGKVAIFIISLVALLLGLAVEIKVIRDIRRPIKMLQEASKKMARGDIEVTLKKYGNNELGQLTDDFQQLVDNVRYQAEIAGRIAAGDMDIEVQVKGEKDVLGNAFAKIVRENNHMLTNIRESAEQVALGAGQVAGASQSLAQGSTDQASAIQQVTASINEIAENTRGSAEQAKVANNLVNKVKEDAETGNVQMQEMIEAMQQINKSSESISKIIKVIDDIAFQTNILALNAAVEAARAGVHGKGFAVVAEEVRNLAGKSAQAASETAEMIEDSIRKVEMGSQLAAETASALGVIVNAVDESVQLMNNIAATAIDQATALTQIDQAVGQVSQVVQTNSATSEECAAASEELLNQASVLKDLMEKFNLKDDRDFEETSQELTEL